jgi:hypothetical protein
LSAESIIYAALSGGAGVTVLVGDRIYPDVLPQGKPLPAIVYARTDTEYLRTIHSNVAIETEVTLEAWCFGDTRPDAEALADAVEPALAAGALISVGRRPEFDADTDTYSSVITCTVSI